MTRKRKVPTKKGTETSNTGTMTTTTDTITTVSNKKTAPPKSADTNIEIIAETKSTAVKQPPVKKVVGKKNQASKQLSDKNKLSSNQKVKQHNQIRDCVLKSQSNEGFHNKYLKELQDFYKKIGHDAFMVEYKDMLKQFLSKNDGQNFATIGLQFLAKFATSFEDDGNTHPILVDTFKWLLHFVSSIPAVRFRMCQFVNLLLNSLGPEAVLDDEICDSILKYMMDRLKDVSPIVRVQAINAMQRLQIPDDPNDMIVKIYQYHLNSDPSPIVRQATITSIGRNFHTIPFIIDRFWDVDDNVRKHTYVQMSSYPVKSYKVGQRLTFLEQGLTDTSPAVRKVVTAVLIPQWLESYKHKYISFISSLKLDAQDSEMERFLKTGKMTLLEIFKTQSIDKFIEQLPLETEGDFAKCLLFDKISVESVLYWLALVEYLHQDDEKMLDLDLILPELSTMCNYITRYLERTLRQEMDKFKQMSHKYILMTLMRILITYDFSDEIGRNNLKTLVSLLLTKFDIDDDRLIIELVKFLEILMPEPDERLQYIVDIVRNIIDMNSTQATMDLSNPVVQELLDRDQNLKVKVSSIKLKILDLEEQEMDCVKQKNYVNAEKIKDRLSYYKEELSSLINPLLVSMASSSTTNISILKPKRKTNEEVTKCLQMVYHVVLSKDVKSLNPHMCTLYNDFIRRQIEVNQMVVRDWALKCGVAFSMLYEQLATDVYYELYMQFYRNQNTKIWITSISGIFDLIDYYGYEFFRPKTATTDETVDGVGISSANSSVRNETTNTNNSLLSATTDLNIKLKNKTSRQLYDKTKYLEATEDAAAQPKGGLAVDVMHLFCHFLDTCEESCIYVALLNGFCRLILRSRYCTVEIITKIILKFFNPSTSSEIQQTLGIFFETLITIKKQECLQSALLPTLMEVLEAPIDSPILEIKPDVIIKFVIKSTLPIYCRRNARIHDKIAISFLCIMNDNISHKDLIRLLSSELKTIELSDNIETKNEIQAGLDQLLNSSSASSIDSKCLTTLKQFKIKLNGGSEVVRFSSTRVIGNGSGGGVGGAASGSGINTSNISAGGGSVSENIAMSDEEDNLTADDLDTEPNIDDILSDIDDEIPIIKKQKEANQKSDNDNKSATAEAISTPPPAAPSPSQSSPPPPPVPPPLNEQNINNENNTSDNLKENIGIKSPLVTADTAVIIEVATNKKQQINDPEKINEKTTPTNRRRTQNKKNTSPQSATTLQSPVNNRSNESIHLPVLTPSPAKPEETAATTVVSSATTTVFSKVVASTPAQPTTPTSNRPTPTTYGLQNSTQVRYLRKSMNPRKLSPDDEIPTKVKVKTATNKSSLENRKSLQRGSESQTENDDIIPGTPSPQYRTSNLRGNTLLRSYGTDVRNPKKNNRIIEKPNTELKSGKRKNVIKSPEISASRIVAIVSKTDANNVTTTTSTDTTERTTGDTNHHLNHIRKKIRTSNYNISENIDSDDEQDEDSLILYRIPERLSRSSIRNLTATDTSPLTVKKSQNNNTTKQQPTTMSPKTITRGLRKNLSNAILEKSKPSSTSTRRSLNDESNKINNDKISNKNIVTTALSEPRRGRPRNNPDSRQSITSKSPPRSRRRSTPPVSPPMTPPPSKQNNRKLSNEKIASGGSAKENQQQQLKQQNLITSSTKKTSSTIVTKPTATPTPPSTPKSTTTKKILSPKSPTNNKRTVTTRKSLSNIESTIKTKIAPTTTTSSTLPGGKKFNNIKKSKLIAPSYSTSSISSITSSTTSTVSTTNDPYNQKQLTRQPRTRQAVIEEIKNNNVLTRNRVVKLPKPIWGTNSLSSTTATKNSTNKSMTSNDPAHKTATTSTIRTTSATAAAEASVSLRPSRIARLKRKQ